MRALVLACAFAAGAWAAPAAPKELSKLDREIVEAVAKRDVAQLDPMVVRRFMELDPESYPPKLRAKAQAKRLEIETLLKIHDGRRKGGIRSIPATGTAGCVPKYREPSYGSVLLTVGYEEVLEEEVECVESRTSCTENDLMCEFTLNVTQGAKKKSGRTEKRYYIHGKDPIMAKVAECRGKAGGQTNFFNSGVFSCNRLQPTP